jgi:cytosine/adenosine deaminase-related metal-dependent hydrolase
MTDAETTAMAASGAIAGLCPITEANLGDGLFPAAAFLDEGGLIGVGSDSNVRIDAAEELRLLEYGQRLTARARNVLAAPGQSTGARLYGAALKGGRQSLGAADDSWVSLNPNDPAFANRSGDAILDSWIFAARAPVDCVWRNGRKLVENGRHIHAEAIAARYRQTLARILA